MTFKMDAAAAAAVLSQQSMQHLNFKQYYRITVISYQLLTHTQFKRFNHTTIYRQVFSAFFFCFSDEFHCVVRFN